MEPVKKRNLVCPAAQAAPAPRRHRTSTRDVIGYAACSATSLTLVGRRMRLPADDVSIDA